jgi:hypothetical protein
MPGVLVNYGINAAIFASLLSNVNAIRIAGFASGWPPSFTVFFSADILCSLLCGVGTQPILALC